MQRISQLVSHTLRWIVCILLAFAACSPDCNAQLDGQLAARPLGVAFMRNMTQASTMQFVKELAERLEVGEEMTKQFGRFDSESLTPAVDEPVSGTAWYMVQGLIPSFAQVTFQEVADAADAKKILEAQKKLMGGSNGVLDVEPNGCYRMVRGNSWESAIPKGQEPEAYVQSLNNGQSGGRGGYKRSAELIEKDGKPMAKQTWSYTTFYRFQDNLLFSSDFDEVWDMELPARDSLLQNADGEHDMGAEAFFDRIPEAYKTLGWNMLNSTAGVQMQRRNDEAAAIADLRKASVQFGLNLVRSLMFDVDEALGWLKWADDDEQSVRAAIDFNTRRNSGLTEQLEDVSSGNSRFGALLQDDAPGTLHLCMKIFEENDAMVLAAGAWLVDQMQAEASGNSRLRDAAADIAATLNNIAEHRTLEVFLKAGWSDESNGVLYGGWHVDDNPHLLSAVGAFLEEAMSSLGGELEFTQRNGQEVLELRFSEGVTLSIAQEVGLNLTHAYVAHQNSCLWIAVGGEDSHEILWTSIDRCAATSVAVRTPLFSAKLDVEQWLTLPQNDPSGVAGWLFWLDANKNEFPPSPVNVRMFGGGKVPPPTPILQRCLDLGGDRRASFTVMADQSGVRATATLGEALANYYVARMIDVQEHAMQAQRKRAETRSKEATKPAQVQAAE